MLPKGQTLARLLHMTPPRKARETAPQLAEEPVPVEEVAVQEETAAVPQEEEQVPVPPVVERRSRGGKYTPRHMR